MRKHAVAPAVRITCAMQCAERPGERSSGASIPARAPRKLSERTCLDAGPAGEMHHRDHLHGFFLPVGRKYAKHRDSDVACKGPATEHPATTPQHYNPAPKRLDDAAGTWVVIASGASRRSCACGSRCRHQPTKTEPIDGVGFNSPVVKAVLRPMPKITAVAGRRPLRAPHCSTPRPRRFDAQGRSCWWSQTRDPKRFPSE